MKKFCTYALWAMSAVAILSCSSPAESDGTLTIDLTQQGAAVNPKMYGIFFEEINHSGDGALYAELICNRNFEEAVLPSGTTYKDGFAVAPHKPSYTTGAYKDWKVAWDADSLKMVAWSVKGDASYDVVADRPLHPNTPHALKLQMREKGVTLQNAGYWGVPMKQGEKYDLRFYLNAVSYQGKVTARVLGEKGELLASVPFDLKGIGWQEYTAEVTPAGSDSKGVFQLVFDAPGMVYIDYVSLFPQKTFKNRKNGMRADVAQMIAELKPGFVRWPGGCIAEGATLENRVKWKETLGDPMSRRSEWILWNYHCTWGFGYHEFLQLCEDLGADPMFVANVGLSCEVRNGDYTTDLAPYIKDIEDAIEYARGDVSTEWGAKRAAAGHPEPFALKYIELGNEQIGELYAERYNQLYKILKEKYPDITFICTLGLGKTLEKLDKVDMIDPHWYVNPLFFYENDRLFDKVERGKYEVYVGEYAAISAGNMDGALSEAAFISGMERNGDLVKIASYAPLLENNNRRDWPTNLIWVNNEGVMGRASYYVQQMFAHHVPTYNVSATLDENLSCATYGSIGFTGDLAADQYRNIRLTDVDGNVIYQSADLAAFKQLKDGNTPHGRRWRPMPTLNLLEEVAMGRGVIEFETRLLQTANPNKHSDGRFPSSDSITHIPALLFAADSSGKNYLTLNLGRQGDSSIAYIARTVDGESNFGRDAQGGDLQLKEGEWSKVRVELTDNDQLVCSVNGKEILRQEVTQLSKRYAIAGYDEAAGETIIKVVNATGEPFTTDITLNAADVEKKGTVITLAADGLKEENSFAEPKKIAPVESEYTKFDTNFSYTFEPYSFTILRVKSK